MSLSVVQVQVEGFDHNFSYLVLDESSKEALLVDPCGEIERVFDEIEKRNLKLTGVLITHSHFDHVERLDDVLKRNSIPVYIHSAARGTVSIPEANVEYVEGDHKIKVGGGVVEVLYTPGHIDDAVCFCITKEYAADSIPKLITGDTVFVEGCGRTNERGVQALYDSLQFIKTLSDETEVYPGHDYGTQPISTVGREKEVNKYFLAKDFEKFKGIRLPNSS